MQVQKISFLLVNPTFYNIEYMSVIQANQKQTALQHQLASVRQQVNAQLSNYRIDLQLYTQKIATSLHQLIHNHIQQSLQQQKFIEQLQQQLVVSKNSITNIAQKLQERDRQMSELKGKYADMKAEYCFKQQKIEQLNKQIQQIRHYIVQMQEQNEKEEDQSCVVNFDDNTNQCNRDNIQNRFNDELQTIKQVSQYDMSVSASMESISSCFNQGIEYKIQPCSSMPQTNSTIEPKPMQNYQQALQFLKNYNNSSTQPQQKKQNSPKLQDSNPCHPPSTSMPRKNKLSITSAKQNIPTPNASAIQSRPHKNETIAKIKKMRKIESLELESGYTVKSDKKNIENGNSVNIEQIPPLVLAERDNNKESLPPSARSRQPSQEIVSLQQPMQHLYSLIENINFSCQQKRYFQPFSPSMCKIQHQNDLHFQGSCDQHLSPQGFGKLMKGKQIVYQGQWRNGKFHGWGKLVLLSFLPSQPNKEIIQVDGNFRNGNMQGTCVCVFTSGQKFMGSVRKGSIEHEGTFVSEKGILTGHWEDSSLVLLI